MFLPARLKKAYVHLPLEDVDEFLQEMQAKGFAHFFDVKDPFKLPELEPVETKEKQVQDALSRLPTPKAQDMLSEGLLGPKSHRIQFVKRQFADALLKQAEKKPTGFAATALREQLQDARAVEKTKSLGGKTQKTLVLGFWFDPKTDDLDWIKRKYDAYEQDADEKDQPPTRLDNPAWLKPFEVLTTNFRVPAHDEVDPTPAIALSFTLFFGFMFADAGYGLALLLLAGAGYALTTKNNPAQKSLNAILIYAALSTIAFGLYFGEFFGFSVNSENAAVHNLTQLLYVSVAAGLAHLFLSGLSQLFGKQKLYGSSVMAVIGGLAAYSWMPESLALSALGVLGLAYAKKWFFFKEILALASSLASYLRLGALAIVHLLIAQILAESLKTAARQPLGLVIAAVAFLILGTLLLVFGALLVFLQSLRLQWVEFLRFGSQDQGIAFTPLREENDHVHYH
ncbi:hypothetical protein HY572_01040 [Candidatus Micrarchaeota archaeon]|nr:hypothetical protein [Candidatus Micrarchaeota archaeon]